MGTRNYTTKILWNFGCIYRIKVIMLAKQDRYFR